jgi:hypothetical protein
MTFAQSIIDAFLSMAFLSMIIQVWGLTHLARPNTLTERGLYRTSMCRVGCSLLYVYVGLNALVFHRAVLATTFFVFCVVQATWQINVYLDVRLRKELDR